MELLVQYIKTGIASAFRSCKFFCTCINGVSSFSKV